MTKRIEKTASDLRAMLTGYRFTLDCGHKFCFHNFSNTLVINPEGKIECSECYQGCEYTEAEQESKSNSCPLCAGIGRRVSCAGPVPCSCPVGAVWAVSAEAIEIETKKQHGAEWLRGEHRKC